ncbi:class I SAM-dependent methyltransferase [Bacillota bacterium]
MQLSDRLSAIAEYVSKGERVADIGTDHGLLPIFLYTRGICKTVILTDIKEGPLRKAEANLKIYAPEMEADLRLGGGLEVLKHGEVDTAVIAGMGGRMIANILEADQEKSRSLRKYILQPRNAQDKLRIWLYKNAYTITNERLVREGNYICEIIVAETGPVADMSARQKTYMQRLGNLEFEISPLLFSGKDPLLKELIECRIKAGEEIISSIRMKGSGDSIRGLSERIERVRKLKELHKYT